MISGGEAQTFTMRAKPRFKTLNEAVSFYARITADAAAAIRREGLEFVVEFSKEVTLSFDQIIALAFPGEKKPFQVEEPMEKPVKPARAKST